MSPPEEPDLFDRARDLDLLVIGDCNPDVLVLGGDVTPAFGQQEKLVGRISLETGGSAAITAVAAARLGLRVALLACVGADAAGSFMLAELAREGVDTSLVLTRSAEPTGMTVALSRGGDRAILTALGAIASLTAADIPADVFRRTRHVHVSSYFLLAGSLGPGLATVLAAARSAGAVTSLDTNWDPAGRWHSAALSAALAETDLLLPNEAEALALSGAPDLDAAVPALLSVIAGSGSEPGPRLAVKLGERGVLCADGESRHQVSLPPVTPADTTGAGDCCNAGLIAGLLQDLPLTQAAALGCAAGALSTSALGGTAGAPGLLAATDLASRATVRAVGLAAVGEIELSAAGSGEEGPPLCVGKRQDCT